MQTKLTLGALVLVAVLIGGVFVFQKRENDSPDIEPGARTGQSDRTGIVNEGTATMENGIQYIDITARGGYSPRKTIAKAGVPTVLRMTTKDTFDCSMALVIPDLKYQSYLKPSATEEIAVPTDKAQGTLRGLCSMAMYQFEVLFEE